MKKWETGLYKSKVPITNLLRDHRQVFLAIALVHLLGTRKYEPFSWLKDPIKSNSTVENNLDAIWRHLSSHSMGKILDYEGLPHVFHMCCRAGMMISTLYRNISPDKVTPTNPGNIEEAKLGMFLTTEEIWSLAKFYYNGTFTINGELMINQEKQYAYLTNLLVEATYTPPTDVSFTWDSINLFDKIFCITLLYAENWMANNWDSKKFIKAYGDKFNNNEISLMELI